MINPQKENGYTAIANELLEAMCRVSCFGSSQGQVLLAILRKTYGWNKKEDLISISQLQDMTRLSRRTVIYALQNLEAKKIITITRSRDSNKRNETNRIAFNKKYDMWVVQETAPQYRDCLMRSKASSSREQERVVQNIAQGSAKVCEKVVQRIDEGSANCLHPQKTNTKDITKESRGRTKMPYAEGVNQFFAEVNGKEKDWIGVLRETYPLINVDAEFKKARAWLLSNTRNQKKNFKRFLNNWIKNAKPQVKGVIETPTRDKRNYDPLPREHSEPPQEWKDLVNKLTQDISVEKE
ncbi:MAG: replication protein [Candidatus Omnitrophica bacterium]|nr:replication protein [Candidatus Omnitrophota bacterium]